MKRKLFYLAAGALAFTACTSEDVVEDVVKNYNAISFENVVNKHSRSDEADITKDNIKNFRVFGFYTTPEASNTSVEIFNDVLVSADSYGNWSYVSDKEDLRHWIPGAHYYFYAYSCGKVVQLDQTSDNKKGIFAFDTESTTDAKNRALLIQDYVCDYSHQHDLIYASNIGASTAENPFPGILGQDKGLNNTVGFKFKHILSKVSASFISKFPEGYTVDISDVRIYNILNQADYTPIGSQGMIDGVGQWLNTERTSETNSYVDLMKSGNENKIINTSTSAAPAVTGVSYVIPYDYNALKVEAGQDENLVKQVSLNFNIKVYNKGQLVFSKLMQGKFIPTWVPGYSYNYAITLDGEAANLDAIAFTTVTDENGNSVADWTTGSTSNPKFK